MICRLPGTRYFYPRSGFCLLSRSFSPGRKRSLDLLDKKKKRKKKQWKRIENSKFLRGRSLTKIQSACTLLHGECPKNLAEAAIVAGLFLSAEFAVKPFAPWNDTAENSFCFRFHWPRCETPFFRFATSTVYNENLRNKVGPDKGPNDSHCFQRSTRAALAPTGKFLFSL